MPNNKGIEFDLSVNTSAIPKQFGVATKEAKEFKKSLADLGKVQAFSAAQKDLEALGKSLATARAEQAKGSKAAAAEVDRLNKAIRDQTGEVAKQSSVLKAAGINTKNLADEQKRLELSYKSSETSLKLAAKAQKNFSTLGVKSLKEEGAEVKKIENAYKSLLKSGKLSAKDRIRVEEAYISKLKEVRGEISKTAKESKGLGGIGAGIAGVGAAAVGFQAVEMFAGFDDQLRAVKALSGATEEEFQKLKSTAYELSGGAAGPTALAEGMVELATSGASVSEILGTTGIVKDMAAASNKALTFAQSGDFLTNTLKQFNLQLGDAQGVSDTLVKAWTSAGTTADEYSQALSYSGTTAKGFGYELEQTSAIILAASEAGIKGTRAGTALTNSMSRLIAPAGQARDILAKYNIQVADSQGNVRKYADIIDDLGAAALTNEEKIRVFGQEAGPAMNAFLLQGGDAIRGFEEKLKSSGGTAKRIATTMQEGLGGSFRELAAQTGVLTSKTVDSVESALSPLLGVTINLVKSVSELPTPLLATGAAMGGIAVSGAGVVSAMAGWSVIAPAVTTATVAIRGYSVAAYSAAAANSAMLGSLAASAVPLAVLGGALYKTQDAFFDMKDAQLEATDSGSRLAIQNAELKMTYNKIRRETGFVVTDWKSLRKEFDEGRIAYDKTTDSYVKGSQKKVDATNEQIELTKKLKEEELGTAEKAKEIQETTYKEIIPATGDALKKITKEWGDLKGQIEKIDDQLLKVSDEGAKAQLKLSNAARSPIEGWNAQKKAVQSMAPAIAAARAEGDKLAAAGKTEEATKSYERSISLLKQQQQATKDLATEVKANFTPAMQQSLDTAKESAKKFGQEYTKAMQDAKKAGDDLKSTTSDLAAAEKGLADAKRDASRAGMTDAQAYQDTEAEQRGLESESKAAAKAGDYDLAIAKAREAQQVASELNQEIKEGESVVLSAEQAKANASAAEISARQLEVAALKAKQAEERKAEAAALANVEKLKAAKEAEAAKVSELEAKKAEVVKTEAEAAKEAAKIEAEARQEITDILEAQREMLVKLADEKNEESGFTLGETYTEAGEQAKALNETAKEYNKLVNQTAVDWGRVWETVQSDGVAAAAEVETKWDQATRDRYITTYVKEVRANQHGGIIEAFKGGGIKGTPRRISPGTITPGYSKTDNRVGLFRDGEGVLQPEPIMKGGKGLFYSYNNSDFVGMANQLMAMPEVSNHFDFKSVPSPFAEGQSQSGGREKPFVFVLNLPGENPIEMRGTARGDIDPSEFFGKLAGYQKHANLMSSR